MKTRTREKRIKEFWWDLARKIPLAFETKKEQKHWVSGMSRLARKEARNKKRNRHKKEED